MNITLNNKEFNEAITMYLNSLGFKANEYNINTKIVAGRGDSGTRAEVELTKINTEPRKEEYNSNSGSEIEDKVPFDVDDKPKTISDIF